MSKRPPLPLTENMEVLLASRNRTSRVALFFLFTVIAAGVGVYIHKLQKLASQNAEINRDALLVQPKVVPVLAVEKPADAPAPGKLAPGTKENVVQASARQTATVQPAPGGSSQKLIADAKVKADAGDLLGARATLNDPLNSGLLGEADADAVRRALSDLNQKLVFSARHYNNDPWSESFPLQPGMRLQPIANRYDITWPLICRVNGYEPTDAGARRIRAGQVIKVLKGPLHALVTKHAFRLDVYLGGLPGEAGATYITSFPVGLGKDDSTPTGLWTVEPRNKLLHPTYYSPRGEGIYKSDDPKNPLGGYWIGLKGEDGAALGKKSYGIHGTIDADSVGKQSSMGCIRLRHDDIAMVYDLLVEAKSRVSVKD